MMVQYDIFEKLSIPVEASLKHENLTASEYNHRGCRIIGGDKGDLHFLGYDVESGETVLRSPILVTAFDDLTEDEVIDYAIEILLTSFESIGAECVEHS